MCVCLEGARQCQSDDHECLAKGARGPLTSMRSNYLIKKAIINFFPQPKSAETGGDTIS